MGIVERNAISRETFWARLKQIGPAFVLAAVVIGPGSLTLSTIAGSLYGYQLLWVPVVATVFMVTYVWMSARIGLVTGKTLFQVTREKYGSGVAKIGGLFGFLAILSFQAGNSAGIGFAATALAGYDMRIWATLFTLLAIGFVFLPELYDNVERLVTAVVAILIVAFFGTLALVGINTSSVITGLTPSFPNQSSIFLALGIAATNFSIAAAVYQTYLMNEKEWGPEHLREESFDSVIGVGILGLIVVAIMLTSASVIYGQTDPVFSARDMAEQLRPLAGPVAFYLFTIGFFFASLSSLVVNALIGATLLVDGFGRNASMEERPVKLWTVVAMLIGLSVVLLFGGSPVELLRIAQALAIVAFPVLGYLVLSLAADDELMGEYANGPIVNTFGILGYLTIIGIVLNYLWTIVGFL